MNGEFEESVKKLKAEIRAARKAARLSQSKLAEMAGMRQPMISRVEDPNFEVTSIKAFKKVCTALGYSLVVAMGPKRKNDGPVQNARPSKKRV